MSTPPYPPTLSTYIYDDFSSGTHNPWWDSTFKSNYPVNELPPSSGNYVATEISSPSGNITPSGVLLSGDFIFEAQWMFLRDTLVTNYSEHFEVLTSTGGSIVEISHELGNRLRLRRGLDLYASIAASPSLYGTLRFRLTRVGSLISGEYNLDNGLGWVSFADTFTDSRDAQIIFGASNDNFGYNYIYLQSDSGLPEFIYEDLDLIGSPTGGFVAPGEPLPVDFSITGYLGSSTGFWNFGDGSPTGYGLTGVSHEYEKPGTYSVIAYIPGATGIQKNDFIVTESSLFFHADPLFGTIPPGGSQSVTFGITGDGSPSSWQWEYGDSDTYSTTNPLLKAIPHDYDTTGFFDVTLRLNNDPDWEVTRSAYILIVEELDLDIIITPPYWYGSLPKDFDFEVANANLELDPTPQGSYPGFKWNLGNGDIIQGVTGIEDYNGYAVYDNYTVSLTLRDIGVSGVASTKQLSTFTTNLVISGVTVDVSPNNIKVGNSVTFTVTFSGTLPNNLRIIYGDGSSSGLVVPLSSPYTVSHTYTVPGQYNESSTIPLSLTVNEGSPNEQTFVRIVGDPVFGDFFVNVSNLEADFTVTPLYGYSPFTGLFEDKSIGALTGWIWDFDDGSTPVFQETGLYHIYSNPGQYFPTLTAYDDYGFSDNESEQVIVLNDLDIAITPSPDTVTQTLTFSPLNDDFANTWEWELLYDDPTLGVTVIDSKTTSSSALKNFEKDFYAPVTYTIRLTITDDLSNQYVKEREFTLSENIQIVTDPSPASGEAPLSVAFSTLNTDTDNVDEWGWDFDNDGVIDSTDFEATNIFNTPGLYQTTLKIIWYLLPGGTIKHTLTKSVFINVGSQDLVVDFTRTPSEGRKPLTVTLAGSSNNPINLWEWVLEGYGVIGSDQEFTYIFQDSGIFQVTLNATDSFGSTASVTKTIKVYDKLTTFDIAVDPKITLSYNAEIEGSGSIGLLQEGGVALGIPSYVENPNPLGFKRLKGPTIIFD